MTTEHPLQPFSSDYVSRDRPPGLFTYAREWFEVIATDNEVTPSSNVQIEEKAYSLNLEALARFLRAPVKTYCQHSLKFNFDRDDEF